MFFWNFLAFFYDPADVGNLISGSSASSKTSLNSWKFTVHILLKAGLENFKHYFTNVWDECNCVVVWAFFGIAFLRIGMKIDLLQSCGHCWVFQICWHIECSTFTASSFRIWNSSTGIPSPPLALFIVVMLLRPTWVHITGCLLLGKCDRVINIFYYMEPKYSTDPVTLEGYFVFSSTKWRHNISKHTDIVNSE